jgi:hypothetical protein
VPDYVYPGCVPGDPSENACCTELCDAGLGDAACPEGWICTDLELPLAPELGVCTAAPPAPGDLQIVEVESDPPGITIYESPWEYIEILNLSDAPIDLALLSIDDSENPGMVIGESHPTVSGDGGCAQVSPTCLAPGRRALFVGSTYMGETGDALVFASQSTHILGTLMQPFTRIWLTDEVNQVTISSYRDWDDPSGPPLPVDEQPLHRIDPAGDDVPANWMSGPGSPGL